MVGMLVKSIFVLFSSLSLSASVLLSNGQSVDVKPLSYNYTVVQNFENSVAEASHSKDGSIKEDEKASRDVKVVGFGFFESTGTSTSEVTNKRDNEYKEYKESHKATTSAYNDTVIVEKIMFSEKMTSVIETALSDAGIDIEKDGDYILTGSIKAMRTNKPRLIPDGSNVRYAVSAVTSIHIKITNKKSGKSILAKTFTGNGQRTFNYNDPMPLEECVDLSIDDLTNQITEALTGKKASTEIDYQDSPGKRLRH